MSAGGDTFGRPPNSHHPPTREAATLKYVPYGPGHEKFPSWPMSAATEVPAAIKTPVTGGSQRSKSWTDHTDYPKEQVIAYTRPYMKRSNLPQPQQLKTVLERCEKKAFDSMQYKSKMDVKKYNINPDYSGSSPPERDLSKRDTVKMSYNNKEPKTSLTQADLEEYTKKFDETTLIQHQKQSSYAQSEGYHSYVSSSDLSSTPFIDSLRRDIDASVASMSNISSWDGDSIVTTRSGSVSSSETLKWHGSLSDMSDVSVSSGTSPRQLIVHSARVQTPQKQNSESVLYMAHSETTTERALPVRNASNTLPSQRFLQKHSMSIYPSPVPPRKTVAECINIYEGKNIKAIQKKALLSFYERHQDQIKKETKISELSSHQSSNATLPKRINHHKEHSTDFVMKCDSPNSIFQGPVIMGPSISLDEWVPERPPKNRNLLTNVSSDKNTKSRRIPSPELPLPSPPLPASDDDLMYKSDKPFPPPPDKLKENSSYSIRTSVDGYIPNYDAHKKDGIDRVTNTSFHKLRDMPSQSNNLTNSLPRKHVNSYKSISKLNVKEKMDKVPSKLTSNTSIQIECEVPQNMNTKQDSLKNKSLPNNRNNNTPNIFLSDVTKYSKNDINEFKDVSQSYTKSDPLIKSCENLNMAFEISGQFRAEPLKIHADFQNLLSTTNDNENLSKETSMTKPISNLKIHRTLSESNHSCAINQVPYMYNNFSKATSYNQSIRRICTPLTTAASFNQTSYIRPENVHVTTWKEHNINENENTKPNSGALIEQNSCFNASFKEVKPPLPEKKRIGLAAKFQDTLNKDKASSNKETCQELQKLELSSKSLDETILSTQSTEINPNKNIKTTITGPVIVTEPLCEKDQLFSSENTEKTNSNSESSNDSNENDMTNVIEHLCPRKYLIDEIHWECIQTHLNFPENNTLQVLLSEYDEYKNTSRQIVDIFAQDVASLLTLDPSVDSKDISEMKNKKQVFINDTINALDKSEETFEIDVDVKKDKEKLLKHLKLMVQALENQESVLDNKMNINEQLGSKIVASLKKPLSTRVSRLMVDIGLITSLMSSLIARHNRISKTLKEISHENENKNLLEIEKENLVEKINDAKALKNSIDNNRTKLFTFLQSDLDDNLLNNYKYYISMKIKLVIYLRDVKDRIDLSKRLMIAIDEDEILNESTV